MFLLTTAIIVSLWMPALDKVRLRFIQQILSEEKSVLHSSQIRVCEQIHATNMEFAVKNVYPHPAGDDEVLSSLPTDEMDFGRMPDRRFFFGILSTLRHEWLEAYCFHCMGVRDDLKL